MMAGADRWRELARDAVVGDAVAMRRLLQAVGPCVLRLVRAVLGNGRVDVEDVAQESLVAFVRALGAFRGECTVLHYACRIAIRTAMAARRRSREADERLAELLRSVEPLDEAQAACGEPAASARRRELVRSLLDELPEAQAETLALRVVLGCSLQEIADATGVPPNTVRSRIRLAKEALRKRIDDDPALAELSGGDR
jgi:RNA polymerase sigma-70 factor (ECF subfamily)